MKENGVIFDLDGTLWEVIEATYNSANEVAKKYKLQEITKEVICNVFGKNKIEAAQMYFPYLNSEKAVELLDEISEINVNYLLNNGGNLYPNLKATLNKLKEKYDLFIVSNSGNIKYVEAFIISANLNDYFKDYIAASYIQITKAEAIEKIILENNLKHAIYVGDTKYDLDASRTAKIPFIHAKYGFCKNLDAKYYIDSFEELPEVVDKIFK